MLIAYAVRRIGEAMMTVITDQVATRGWPAWV